MKLSKVHLHRAPCFFWNCFVRVFWIWCTAFRNLRLAPWGVTRPLLRDDSTKNHISLAIKSAWVSINPFISPNKQLMGQSINSGRDTREILTIRSPCIFKNYAQLFQICCENNVTRSILIRNLTLGTLNGISWILRISSYRWGGVFRTRQRIDTYSSIKFDSRILWILSIYEKNISLSQ